MEGIQISVYYVGVQEDIALIQIGGYLDTVTSPQLETALEDVTEEGYANIICDLGSVNYISSAGWGIFVSKIKRLRDMGGDLVLSKMIPDVFDVFQLLEFDRILKFYDNTDKAIKEFDEARGLSSIPQDIDNGSVDPDSPFDPDRERRHNDLLHKEVSANKDYPRSLLTPTIGDNTLDRRQNSTAEIEYGKKKDVQIRELSDFSFLPGERNILDRDLPLNEKVKLAVIDNPLAGVNTIRKVLNSSRFGYVTIGFWKLRKIFKELDLDSREKRYRFWRSR
jgi:anti-anti-sigma factor